MDSRLIFLHSAVRLKQRDGSPRSVGRLVVAVPKGRGHLIPKLVEEIPRKAVVDNQSIRTKTDTGRRGEKPQALERTVVKELGKLTPYVRNKGALPAFG